ncbi:MAG TPA: hypothetical protein VHZ53_06005 [Steroidobacteraceae bacterium]|nr:hypothetical protein [Steroidobacteraceae bacterium]
MVIPRRIFFHAYHATPCPLVGRVALRLMINRCTAFVLGAGTSIPYRFPSGEGLLKQARVLSIPDILKKIQRPELEGPARELEGALKKTHDSSLDALLELRPDLAEVGKRLLAALLLEHENSSITHFPEPEEDWLTVFFGELVRNTSSIRDFAKNPISFITYNYDRALKHRILGALSAHYGISELECATAIAAIPFLHLHGDLGELPSSGSKTPVPFGPSPTDAGQFARYLDIATARIVIVHEAKPETEAFVRARDILGSSEQAVMLGFGFGESNLSRLDVAKWKATTVWGTAFGLTGSQRHYLIDIPFDKAKKQRSFASSTVGTRAYLLNSLYIFRDPLSKESG